MNPNVLTVYKSPFPKIRLGKDFDGGYVIADIPNATFSTFLAGGILDDISFEEAFLKKYPGTFTVAFDGSIPRLPKENADITFVKKYIGDTNTDTYTNLHDIINVSNNLFVKMDIEGGEIPWITSLSEEQIDKFDQIAMEFHEPFHEKEIAVFDKINRHHYLVHFHPNNCCGVRNHMGVDIPVVFECTYLHKRFFAGRVPELNTESIPGPLDMKNVLWLDDIVINYPPFVN